jgi:hypothetical protein
MWLAEGDTMWAEYIYGTCYTDLHTVFASPVRVRFAHDCGLQLDDELAHNLQ